ncbi:MAG: hypothetical protein GYB31_05910 [Bacteroidetes bacterium]|nr:hypothetical protein [Bacteroidota bacterium]
MKTHLLHRSRRVSPLFILISFFPLFLTAQDDPVAVCDTLSTVNLGVMGTSLIAADYFDAGSSDDSCLDYFEVRRPNGGCPGTTDDVFQDSILFCCDDLFSNPIEVIFRAYDCDGNFDDCDLEVTVVDAFPPFMVSCPGTQTVDCATFLSDYLPELENENWSVLDDFGVPLFYDECYYETETSVSWSLNDCSSGSVARLVTASDLNPDHAQPSCTHTIIVEHLSDFVVSFPEDITVDCDNGILPDTGAPEVFLDECEMTEVSYEDQYFFVVPDACYKIVRTWTVVNGCLTHPDSLDVYPEEDFSEAALGMDWDGDGDQDEHTFRDGWNETGAPGMPDGILVFTQEIKVNDTEQPVFEIPIDTCITANDCQTDFVIPLPTNTDACAVTTEISVSGDFGTYDPFTEAVVIPGVGLGEYTIDYTFIDNCGNTSYQSYDITVVDCQPPVAFCQTVFEVEIPFTLFREVQAEELDLASFDNCPGNLIFSFSADVNDQTMTVDCSDLGEVPVELWATDATGLQGFCETNITVLNNLGYCVEVPLSGLITDADDDPVAGIEVVVNSGAYLTTTDILGGYALNLYAGGDFEVAPQSDMDPMGGVTTIDLLLISQHILGVNVLSSPYQLLAADANNSGGVSTLDIVSIRKVILALETEFPNNTIWRFIDADYQFPEPENPWAEPFPESIVFFDYQQAVNDADFIAVKTGDVNHSAQ